LAQGIYTITYSAENYESVQKTITILNDQPTIQNVALLPENQLINTHNPTVLQLYPNPVTNELKIENYELKEGESVQILDLAGKIIYNSSFINYNSIDVSNLFSGVYFLKIGNYIGKFVKQP